MPHVSVNSVWLYYEIHGEGFPLVLLHGGDGNSGSWHKQLPVYGKNFKIILVDERGFGQSSAPPCDYDRFSVARDIIGLLGVLGIERAFLLGYSMGGATALRVSLLAPRRIAAMVISGTGSRWMVPESFRRRLVQALPLAEEVGCGGLFERLFVTTVFSERFRAECPDEVRRYRNIVDQNSPTAWIMRVRADLTYEPGDVGPYLGEIGAPTRIICGEHDYNRSRVEGVHERLPNSNFHLMRDAAHAAFYEKPEQFNELVLDFLLPRLPAG